MTYLKNLNFKTKLITLCICVSILPTLFIGYFSYYQIRDYLIEKEEISLETVLTNEINHINTSVDKYLSTVDALLWNKNLQNILVEEFDNNYQMYLAYSNTIDPLFTNVRASDNYIKDVCIYTEHKINPHGHNLQPLAKAQNLPWFSQDNFSYQPLFTLSDDKSNLYLTCQYNNHYPETSILCLTIDFNKLVKSCNTLFDEEYKFELIDSTGRIIYSFSNCKEDYLSYVVKKQPLSLNNYYCKIYRPAKSIIQCLAPVKRLTFSLLVLCIVFIFFVSYWLSNILVKPLVQLSKNMKQLEAGNYNIVLEAQSDDEIGNLINSFNHLSKHLNHLINEVLNGQIEQHKKDLQILQLQINPHFLYNSLSLINSRAILSGQHAISQMAQHLTTFYRTMLNQGLSTITIKNEIENARSYIEIQQIMHNYSFETIYEIDENMLDLKIPNMLLQPLAENAILHGIDQKTTDGKGILTLSVFTKDNQIILQIMDNGCGMEPDTCASILTTTSKGYGVKNVQQRINLIYGNEYGLKYKSIPNRGTLVQIILPQSP